MTEYVVDVVPGVVRQRWCDNCNTSAAVDIDIHVVNLGSSELGPVVGSVSGCMRCDPDWSSVAG